MSNPTEKEKVLKRSPLEPGSALNKVPLLDSAFWTEAVDFSFLLL